MLRRIYHLIGLSLERRPWGIRLLYHSIRHYKIYELLEALVVALVFALVIRTFIFQPFKIPSESMDPTLQVGDRLFVNKMVYYFHPPRVGDIVVFKTPPIIYDRKKPIFIKRVVGLEGDEVSIQANKLYINGVPSEYPAIRDNDYTVLVTDAFTERSIIYSSKKVPEDEIYVFGDNSPYSYDSRCWGGVPLKNVKGKAVFRWWPPERFGWIK